MVPSPLSRQVRMAYGIGELTAAMPASLSAFFLLYFFTTVAGLSPGLAGGILLLGRLWDGINDPVIGWLSDHTRSPLGRRYPWMLLGAIPLAACSTLLWYVPPVDGQWLLFSYYFIFSLFALIAVTAVQLPYTALAAELTEDYDERMVLTGIKSAFSIGSGILAMVLAQVVFVQVVNPELQYLILGAISSVLGLMAIGICVAGTYRQYWKIQSQRSQRLVQRTRHPLGTQLRSVFSNYAFRQVLGLYLCGWMGIQVTAAMLPYFVDVWMGLPSIHFAQMALVVQGTAIVAIFGWSWLSRRSGKRTIFLAGAPLAAIGLVGMLTVQPGQIVWMYFLGMIIGLGVAVLYLVPFAMLPDVIDLDELTTGQRREGLYFSAVVFLQKLGLAIALFMSGQLLEWTGFQSGTSLQTTSALWTIRLLLGLLPALLLLGSLVFAYRYPITRERHQEIQIAIQERHQS